MAIGYRAAIQWIIDNDDTEWIKDPNGYMSVTATMVADIYGKDDQRVRKDLKRAMEKKEAA